MEIKRDTGLFNRFIISFWEYYNELENEFISLRKYVSICEDNFNTYSVEILKLYQAVCSEIDAIGKAMAQLIEPEFKPDDKQNNIFKWWYEILDTFMITEAPFTYNNQCPVHIRIGLRDYKCRLLDSLDIHPWTGFEVEMMLRFSLFIERPVHFSGYKFIEIIDVLRTHRADVAAANLFITPERSDQVLFSHPYYLCKTSCFSRVR